ncbi:unnamed protein product [Orchesella dallaii]|uniref:Uncharacterized protein n=1 Tax=Orchesella dallaii TaxID=48710 RepID=A0ABP1QZ31_9HEXA
MSTSVLVGSPKNLLQNGLVIGILSAVAIATTLISLPAVFGLIILFAIPLTFCLSVIIAANFVKELYLALYNGLVHLSRFLVKVIHTFLWLTGIESVLIWVWSRLAPQTDNIVSFPVVANY